jgi:exopolysaccharide biosynthesis protein
MTAFAVAATNAAAQPANVFQPTRCLRDTTAALSITSETETSDSVAPGIRYRCLYIPRGPWALHVATIDLRNPRYVVDGVRAKGVRLGRERVSDMVQRLAEHGDTALVAINADFFSLATGEVENNAVIRGEWVKGVVLRDAAHDQHDNARTQFAVDERGRPLMGRFELHGEVLAGRDRAALSGINHRPVGEAALVKYTSWYGATTPRDSTTSHVLELGLQWLHRSGSETTYRVIRGSLTSGGGAPITPRGAVLSATGSATAFLRDVAARDTLHIITRLGSHDTAPQTVVGGWPRLIVDGHSVAALADSLEGTLPRFSAARHPRSAIAMSRDSSMLMLVVVDGRRPWSAGMSLGELAEQLLALGAFQAMNLDGGGSSVLWIRGTVVNYPSDQAGERPVGNALIVRKGR